MRKGRKKRPGPKKSQPVDLNQDEGGAPHDETEDKETSEESTKVQETPNDVGDGSEKGSAEVNVDEPDASAPKILNEIDGTLVNAPESETVEELEQAKPVLRLVPLMQLLKPDLIDKPASDKTKSSKKVTSRKSKKSASYIEISSDSSDAQISISSTTSDSSDDDVIRKKNKRDAGSSKENSNSTNSKLSNGTGKPYFKEPKEKSAKSFSVNLEKMPNNVNKLMKFYRVNEASIESIPSIESWSETDDFENMISTSKIDRVALDKSNKPETDDELLVEMPTKSKKVIKKKQLSDDEMTIKKKPKKIVSDNDDNDRPKRPERNSARNAKIRTKKVIESDVESSSSESDKEEEESLPLNPRFSKKTETASTSSRSTRNKRTKAIASDSEEDEYVERKKYVSASEADSSTDEKKPAKKKKKIPQDDHEKEKAAKAPREKSTSSEEEAPKRGRSIRSKEPEAKRSTRSKKEVAQEPEPRTSRQKGKASELKITINLNKNKVLKPPKDDDSDTSTDEKNKKKQTSSIDSAESSLSDDDRPLQPVKLTMKNSTKRKKISSESEDESSNSVEAINEIVKSKVSECDSEISEEEKCPILDQKLRARNKFEKNSAFLTLKQKIEQRKIKRKPSVDEETSKTSTQRASRRNKTNGVDAKKTSERNNNDKSEKSEPDDDDENNLSAVIKIFISYFTFSPLRKRFQNFGCARY